MPADEWFPTDYRISGPIKHAHTDSNVHHDWTSSWWDMKVKAYIINVRERSHFRHAQGCLRERYPVIMFLCRDLSFHFIRLQYIIRNHRVSFVSPESAVLTLKEIAPVAPSFQLKIFFTVTWSDGKQMKSKFSFSIPLKGKRAILCFWTCTIVIHWVVTLANVQ